MEENQSKCIFAQQIVFNTAQSTKNAKLQSRHKFAEQM
jgi:hypothetical protein